MADNFVISEGNLVKIRSDKQHSIPMLSIQKGATVLTASLSALPTASDNSVADLPITVVSGDYTKILPDMTCLIMNGGETEIIGTVRVRKVPTSTHLYISEDNNDTVRRWVVGYHLIVLDEFCIWPKHLRIVDEEDPDSFCQDWEITYTDQHEHPDPILRVGPPVIPVLWDTGEEIEVTIDASASIIPYGSDTISSWAWTQTGGMSISGETTNIPIVTVNATGRVVVTGTATSSAGKTMIRRVYIEAYDRRGTGRPPVTLFELINSPEGNAEQGGWKFSVKMYGEASKTDIRDRALVTLFSRDFYQDMEESLGPIAGREHIVVWGWIVGETIEWDADGGFVTFDVEGAAYWLEKTKTYVFGLQDTDWSGGGGGAPDNLVEMENLTVDKVVYVLVHLRSTITKCCDIYFSGSTRQASVIQSAAANLWSQLVDICYLTILALPIFDRYGRLHISTNQNHLPLDERDALPVVMDVTTDDHIKTTITRRVMPRYSRAHISGVYWINGDFAPIGAFSPGKVPVLGEEEFDEQELVMVNQDDTLEQAGLIAGSGDREIDGAIAEMPRCNRFFDIAPHMYATVTITAADNERGMAVTGARLIPRTIRLPYDNEAGAWGAEVEFEGEGAQWGAVKETFPTEGEPPIEPPTEPPEEPPAPPEEPPEPPEPGEADAVVATDTDVRTTADLDEASPTWTSQI
jgi:hypothetical protein